MRRPAFNLPNIAFTIFAEPDDDLISQLREAFVARLRFRRQVLRQLNQIHAWLRIVVLRYGNTILKDAQLRCAKVKGNGLARILRPR